MKKNIKKIVSITCIVLFVVDILALVYFFVKTQHMFKISDGVTYDGFGREITTPPLLIRRAISQWAGYGWFIFDTAVSWFMVGIAYLLWNCRKRLKKEGEMRNEQQK